MADIIIYTASDVYKRLEVSDSTLRKYMEVLQRESYIVKKINVAEENIQSLTLWFLRN